MSDAMSLLFRPEQFGGEAGKHARDTNGADAVFTVAFVDGDALDGGQHRGQPAVIEGALLWRCCSWTSLVGVVPHA